MRLDLGVGDWEDGRRRRRLPPLGTARLDREPPGWTGNRPPAGRPAGPGTARLDREPPGRPSAGRLDTGDYLGLLRKIQSHKTI